MCELTCEKPQANILKHQENISNARNAHQYDFIKSIILRLIKRFKTEGILDKKPKTERPKLSSKRADATLARLRSKNRFPSSSILAREWNVSTILLPVPEQFAGGSVKLLTRFILLEKLV